MYASHQSESVNENKAKSIFTFVTQTKSPTSALEPAACHLLALCIAMCA
jgi:hypothetical protein